MSPQPRVLVLALGLVAAGLVASPTATAAPPAISAGTIALTTSFAKASGPTCAITSTGESPTPKTVTDTQKVTQTLNSTSQTTNSGDANDVTNASGTTRTTVIQKVAHGTLESLNISARTTATVKAGESSSTCASSSAVLNVVMMKFKVPADGFVNLTSRSSGGTVVEGGVQDDQTEGLSGVLGGQGDSTATTRAFVTKGTAHITSELLLELPNPITTDRITRSGSFSLHATYVPAGTGLAKPTGPGAAYVAFPSGTVCMGHQVTLALKPAARNASAISFFVNGRLARKVAHPAAGKKVAVTVPFRKDAVISVAVTRGHQTLRGKRTYTACSV